MRSVHFAHCMEWTYDGRDEGTTTGVLTFGSVEPVRAVGNFAQV